MRVVPVQQAEQRPRQLGALAFGRQPVENPVLLAESLEHAGLGQQAQVTRHARLALPKEFGQFSDCEFALRQQRQKPQAAGVGDAAQAMQQLVGRMRHFRKYNHVFILLPV